jgi:hypothetical protein
MAKGTVSCERDDASVLYTLFVRSVSEPEEILEQEIFITDCTPSFSAPAITTTSTTSDEDG